MRAISKAAGGLGPNYVQQMLKDEKDPTFPRLAKVLKVLGPGATLYVTLGLRLTPDLAAFLQYALSLDSPDTEQVRAALSLLRDRASERESATAPALLTHTKRREDEKHHS